MTQHVVEKGSLDLVPAVPGRSIATRIWTWVRRLIPVAIGLILLFAPNMHFQIPVVLPGAASSPGALEILGVALVYAGVAMSFDLLYGYAGLMSFGHALFFGIGVYGTNLLMIHQGLSLAEATLIAFAIAVAVALVVGSLSLRLRGIGFAMVTLAFVEVLIVLVDTDPFHISGREQGLALSPRGVPKGLLGVIHTKNTYWLALAYAALVLVVGLWLARSKAGLVWKAVRENEDRLEMLGVPRFPSKLLVFVIGSGLASLGGSAYVVLTQGSNPGVVSTNFSLALLVMVILGGAGKLYGAALGGALYGILTLRLPSLSTSGALDQVPAPFDRILAEPLFLLGVAFILIILFLPNGLASVGSRIAGAKRALATRDRR